MEKEIERLIRKELTEPGGAYIDSARIAQAAHTLAEAMQEDVVYESTGVADYDGCCVRLGRGTELILGPDDEWDILDGRQYHVTVTEEPTNDQP